MTDMTKTQKHKLCLEAVVEMKEKIVNDKAVYCIERAVCLMRQWLNEHTDVSYELYDLLDNEETGFTLFQESESDESMIAVWNCIIDAVAYVCRDVFDEFGATHYPEPIESVDEDVFHRLLDTYKSI